MGKQQVRHNLHINCPNCNNNLTLTFIIHDNLEREPSITVCENCDFTESWEDTEIRIENKKIEIEKMKIQYITAMEHAIENVLNIKTPRIKCYSDNIIYFLEEFLEFNDKTELKIKLMDKYKTYTQYDVGLIDIGDIINL